MSAAVTQFNTENGTQNEQNIECLKNSNTGHSIQNKYIKCLQKKKKITHFVAKLPCGSGGRHLQPAKVAVEVVDNLYREIKENILKEKCLIFRVK
jgi:hypothetical protein